MPLNCVQWRNSEFRIHASLRLMSLIVNGKYTYFKIQLLFHNLRHTRIEKVIIYMECKLRSILLE